MGTRDRKELVKEIIRSIHAGADPEEAKRKFRDQLADVSPLEIGRAEQELIQEGLPREEVRRLCDVHLAVMADALSKKEADVPPGHPVHTFREEHRMILEFVEMLRKTARELLENPTRATISARASLLEDLAEHLWEVEKHNVREENALFPYMEKHGITEPPAIMWSEHNSLRDLKKRLKELVQARERRAPEEYARELVAVTEDLGKSLSSHIARENDILYPMALKVLSREEWAEIRRQCDELGYCCFTPELAPLPTEEPRRPEAVACAAAGETRLTFPTGSLTAKELECLLNTLPCDISFVDREDSFRYYNSTRERIFPRTPASLGRKLHQCHPPKSLPLVNQIVGDFKGGRRDAAHFWIQKGEKLVHISYFAVRDEKGEYLGVLETTQDIAPLQQIKGEKRLL